jgi:prepilin-type N-terminal cleavage/methylation domain-containing protein
MQAGDNEKEPSTIPRSQLMKRRMFRARGGYTLIEVATSVVIVAVLTAAVVPVIVKQIDNAEPTRVANDLNAMSKAIETFHMNLRPTYPSDLYQLVSRISAASSVPMEDDVFLEKHVQAWLGPYINSTVPGLAAELTTGFGATIHGELYWVNSNAPLVLGDTNPKQGGGIAPIAGADFIALKLTGLTVGEFSRLDMVLDGDASSSTGRLRYILDGDDVIAYFFAVPYSG